MVGIDMSIPKCCKECKLFKYYIDLNGALHFICKFDNREIFGKFEEERNEECPLIEIQKESDLMTIEQAMQRLKEHKILFAHDHGYDETTIHALDIAIKSLEAWDKVIKEIEDDEQMAFMYGSIDMYTGIKESREVVEKYKKEIEE